MGLIRVKLLTFGDNFSITNCQQVCSLASGVLTELIMPVLSGMPDGLQINHSQYFSISYIRALRNLNLNCERIYPTLSYDICHNLIGRADRPIA